MGCTIAGLNEMEHRGFSAALIKGIKASYDKIEKKMEKKIKLIWDFRSRDVEHFAEHHAKHLKEFLEKENYAFINTGVELINEHHALAYMVVFEKDMLKFRDALKPHRAVYYTA